MQKKTKFIPFRERVKTKQHDTHNATPKAGSAGPDASTNAPAADGSQTAQENPVDSTTSPSPANGVAKPPVPPKVTLRAETPGSDTASGMPAEEAIQMPVATDNPAPPTVLTVWQPPTPLDPDILNSNRPLPALLSPDEKKQREECDEIIKRGKKVSIEVGAALKTVRDLKLYREDHETFEQYVEHFHGFGRQYAYKVVKAAEVAADLSSLVDDTSALNERQLRSLAPLNRDDRRKVWSKAMELAKGEKVTTQLVKKAINICGPEITLPAPKPSKKPRKTRKPQGKVTPEDALDLYHEFCRMFSSGANEDTKLAVLERLGDCLTALANDPEVPETVVPMPEPPKEEKAAA